MKIAIIGSRNLSPLTILVVAIEIYETIEDVNVTEVISGGARGIDSIAEKAAKVLNKTMTIIRPNNPSKKQDYILRNFKIVDQADKIIAYWNGKSKGTLSTINYAKRINKEIVIREIPLKK